MAINIAVVEENWFNLLEALDDGEYDEPICESCGQDPCVCDLVADETWDVLVEHAIYVQGGN